MKKAKVTDNVKSKSMFTIVFVLLILSIAIMGYGIYNAVVEKNIVDIVLGSIAEAAIITVVALQIRLKIKSKKNEDSAEAEK